MSGTQNASSTSTPSSSTRLVFGTWRTPSPAERDIEAQIIVGHHEPFTSTQIPAPPSVYTHQPRTSLPSSQAAAEEGTDPLDDFFGATPRSGTRESRHDAYVTPPPYEAESADPPAYSEYPTLAMYLFKFGFLFPPFWVFGAFILMSTLQAPAEWETQKSEEERTALIQELRRVEVKWAKRCLIALSMFLLVATIVTVALVFHFLS